MEGARVSHIAAPEKPGRSGGRETRSEPAHQSREDLEMPVRTSRFFLRELHP